MTPGAFGGTLASIADTLPDGARVTPVAVCTDWPLRPAGGGSGTFDT